MHTWRALSMAFGLMIAATAIAQSKNDGTAMITGMVIGANTPIVVYLQPTGENPTRYYDGYKAEAKSDGSFVLANIEPGSYRIRAEASGFIAARTSSDAAELILLHVNETRKNVRVTMVPVTQVCGRVTENGTAKKTWVDAWRLNPESDTLSRNFLPATDADGNYRFADLAPGTYFLQGYTTWYPGVASFTDAKPVVVGPDTEKQAACHFDIPLQYTGCAVTKVHGTITKVPGLEDAQFQVSFRERNSAGVTVRAHLDFLVNKVFKGGDNFEGAICPGSYEVVLSDDKGLSWWSESLSHSVVFDRQQVTVGNTMLDGIVLTPRPMASIQGEVHFEDITREVICSGRGGQQVSILRDGDGQFQSAELDSKNQFSFKNVAPGDYSLYLGPVRREAVFLKSIEMNGKPVAGRRFTVAQAQPIELNLILSGDIEQAEGHVSPDDRGEPRWQVEWMRPKGSVAGSIQADAGGDFTVTLRSARYNSNASGEYSVHAAADSSFHFDNVDPGVYTLRAESKTYVAYEYAAHHAGLRGVPIVVGRGAHLDGLVLKPLKLSAVCGRVTDNDGTPQSGRRIFFEDFKYGNEHLVGFNAGHLTTDENGLFHAEGIPPGEYFIGFSGVRGMSIFSSDGSLGAAEPIRLIPGKDAGCGTGAPLELRMPKDNEPVHTISGQIAGDLPAKIGNRFWVWLMDVNDDGSERHVTSATVNQERLFSLEKVPNGKFRLDLHSGYGPEPMMWSGPYGPVAHLLATQQVEVRDVDVVGVKITPMELPAVDGVVRYSNLPESWKSFDLSSQRITLIPRTRQAPFSAKLSSDGSFSLDPEDPGEYEVELNHPGQLYVRSIRLNDHPVEGRYFRLSANATAKLEVEVRGDGGKLNFSVTPDASLPTPEPSRNEVCFKTPPTSRTNVEIILLPDPLFAADKGDKFSVEKRIFQAYGVHDDHRTWQQLTAVPPGHYRAIAGEHIFSLAFRSNRSDLTAEERRRWEALAQLGQPITVEADSEQEITLPDRTAEVARLAGTMGLRLDAMFLDREW
jgi:hypothetical protein